MKQKKMLAIMLLIPVIFMTGCQMIQETFGKEYRMIDDFYEQLEADIVYSCNKMIDSTEGKTEEEKAAKREELDILVAELHTNKEEVKALVRIYKEEIEDTNLNVPLDVYLEETFLKARQQFKKEIEEASNNEFTLESTEVNRGFLGSIWHFIRNHWLLTLIIIGIIGHFMD